MGSTVRVCFVGDSFVAGVGDESHRGWAGILISRAIERGYRLTGYNLGIRGDTSALIGQRFVSECEPRLAPGDYAVGVVFSFGVNDVIRRGGQPRVAPSQRVENLDALIDEARQQDWPVLMIGPPPISDDELNGELRELDAQLQERCRAGSVPYLSVFEPLVADAQWRSEVAADDGAHPRSSGYELLAELVDEGWASWLQNICG